MQIVARVSRARQFSSSLGSLTKRVTTPAHCSECVDLRGIDDLFDLNLLVVSVGHFEITRTNQNGWCASLHVPRVVADRLKRLVPRFVSKRFAIRVCTGLSQRMVTGNRELW